MTCNRRTLTPVPPRNFLQTIRSHTPSAGKSRFEERRECPQWLATDGGYSASANDLAEIAIRGS